MRTLTKGKFLEVFPAFSQGSPTLVDDLLAFSKYAKAPPQAFLQLQGHYCSSLALMLSGEKRIYKVTEAKKEITLYQVGPGEVCILNATCILANALSPVNARALTQVEMLLLPPARFLKLLDDFKEIRTYIFDNISKTLAEILELIMELTFKRMGDRLLDYLIEKSEDGKLHTTHQTIANDLGTSRVVVSRLLKKLEQKGRVHLSRSSIELTYL